MWDETLNNVGDATLGQRTHSYDSFIKNPISDIKYVIKDAIILFTHRSTVLTVSLIWPA